MSREAVAIGRAECAEAEFGPAAFAEAMSAPPDVLDGLARFQAHLAEWNAVMNLVGPTALSSFWRRHALDSAQLLKHAPDARTWVDLGSGAGFPGLILAILLKGRAGAQVHLVESAAKRTRFLTSVVELLDLPASVHLTRAEDWRPPSSLDIVTARACAPLARLLDYAWPCLKNGRRAFFLKGQGVAAEIDQARASWRFDLQVHPSLSDPSGNVVQIDRLARV